MCLSDPPTRKLLAAQVPARCGVGDEQEEQRLGRIFQQLREAAIEARIATTKKTADWWNTRDFAASRDEVDASIEEISPQET